MLIYHFEINLIKYAKQTLKAKFKLERVATDAIFKIEELLSTL